MKLSTSLESLPLTGTLNNKEDEGIHDESCTVLDTTARHFFSNPFLDVFVVNGMEPSVWQPFPIDQRTTYYQVI